jgi:hypothetical protein
MTPDYSLSGLKLLLLGLGKTSLVQLIGQQLNFTKQFVNISPHKYRGMGRNISAEPSRDK